MPAAFPMLSLLKTLIELKATLSWFKGLSGVVPFQKPILLPLVSILVMIAFIGAVAEPTLISVGNFDYPQGRKVEISRIGKKTFFMVF